MTDRYATLARYNHWANERLYAAAGRLPDADYRADRGAFFKSVHGTLNHLLVTDRIWMARFAGSGDAPPRLDAILFDDFRALSDARRAQDARLLSFVEGLGPDALMGGFRYARATSPDQYEQPLETALDHLFNHQTHHRGQIHALLTGLAGDAPTLDLLAFQRAAGLSRLRPAK